MILPGDDERLTIIGRTGSGKTVAGLWHLSKRSFDKMPWVIFNFKDDIHIGQLLDLGAKETDIGKKPPEKRGLYVANILPDSNEQIDTFLRRCWENGNTGVYVDEGFMLPSERGKYKWYRAVLTQGRSRKVPVITLTQRPFFLDRFAFSEADRFQIFDLNDNEDIDRIKGFVNYPLKTIIGPSATNRLPAHHSLWYDVKRNEAKPLLPVPKPDIVLDTFHARLQGRRKII